LEAPDGEHQGRYPGMNLKEILSELILERKNSTRGGQGFKKRGKNYPTRDLFYEGKETEHLQGLKGEGNCVWETVRKPKKCYVE